VALTKAGLVNSVIDTVRFRKRKKSRQLYLFPEFEYDLMSRKRATKVVNSLFEIIKKALEKEETVMISGFGKFEVKFKWARKGRNPRTGKSIIINSCRLVSFRCSPVLRQKINSSQEHIQVIRSITSQ
jgi:integration host factor subunit alpha